MTRIIRIRSAVAPMLIATTALRLKGLVDALFAEGIATIFSGSPSSNLHWETEKLEYS